MQIFAALAVEPDHFLQVFLRIVVLQKKLPRLPVGDGGFIEIEGFHRFHTPVPFICPETIELADVPVNIGDTVPEKSPIGHSFGLHLAQTPLEASTLFHNPRFFFA